MSPWARVSAGGLPRGAAQVRWWLRFVSSVVNCWLVSPVVRWWGNGLSGVALRMFVVIYPQFFAVGGAVV